MDVPYQLTTERLFLRRLIRADIQPIYAFLNDTSSTRYMAFTLEQKTFASTTRMVESAMTAYSSGKALYMLAIVLKHTGEFIGFLGASPDTNATEIFYALLPDYRGQGYATEAAQRLIQSLIEDNGIQRIVAYVMTDNAPSIQVAKRLGMVLETEVIRDGYESSRYLLTRP